MTKTAEYTSSIVAIALSLKVYSKRKYTQIPDCNMLILI